MLEIIKGDVLIMAKSKIINKQLLWAKKNLSRLKKTSECDITINDKSYRFKKYPYRILESVNLNIFNLPVPKDIIAYDTNIKYKNDILRIVHIENIAPGTIDKDIFENIDRIDKFLRLKFIACGCRKINLIFSINKSSMSLIDI